VDSKLFGDVVRCIRTDSILKDPEIGKMHIEWLECLDRPYHKFSDLLDLDFLLFHLGLIVSPKLLKRLSNTYLNTVFEDEVESPRNIEDEKETVNDHLMPSFMKTMEETTNFELLKSHLVSSRLKLSTASLSTSSPRSQTPPGSSPMYKSPGPPQGPQQLAILRDDEEEEKDSYHDTKRKFVSDLASEFEKVTFKLIDLVGEFIDDQDNTILIQDGSADEGAHSNGMNLNHDIDQKTNSLQIPSQPMDPLMTNKSVDAIMAIKNVPKSIDIPTTETSQQFLDPNSQQNA